MVARLLPLAVVGPGDEVRVRSVRGEEGQARRLRELGVLEGRTLRIVANRDPLICEIGEGRFGLGRRLARCVLVEPVGPNVA